MGNLAPVSNRYHQYTQHFILNIANYTIVSYPVTPQSCQWSAEAPASRPWVFQNRNLALHLCFNTLGNLSVKSAKLTLGYI